MVGDSRIVIGAKVCGALKEGTMERTLECKIMIDGSAREAKSITLDKLTDLDLADLEEQALEERKKNTEMSRRRSGGV